VAWLIEGIQKSAKNEQITEITIADSHSRGLNLAYARAWQKWMNEFP